MLSVALIVKDEASRLPAWLRAVAPLADEIVAVDAGSSDQSVALLTAAGARVFHREFSGYADQRNHAASLCRGDWILCLDADERPDPGLCAALDRLKNGPPPAEAAFSLEYKVFFFGRFLRHGGYFPERHPRLHRAGQAAWVRDQVHERLLVQGTVGVLRGGYVEHHSYQSVLDYLRRLPRYAEAGARALAAAGKTAGPLTALGHAAWAFGFRYLLRLGFLDGFEGYLAARLEATYTLAKYARLRELGREPKP